MRRMRGAQRVGPRVLEALFVVQPLYRIVGHQQAFLPTLPPFLNGIQPPVGAVVADAAANGGAFFLPPKGGFLLVFFALLIV